MKYLMTCRSFLTIVFLVTSFCLYGSCSAVAAHSKPVLSKISQFPLTTADYREIESGKHLSLVQTLRSRINICPFNLFSTILFFCAITHTFLATKLAKLSKYIEKSDIKTSELRHFLSTIFHFLGEVEVIFGIWVLPLLVLMWHQFGWRELVNYFDNVVSFDEPIFVVIIMAMASSRPILSLSESVLRRIANLFGGTVVSWWMTILIVTPFLGSLITEPAAMTISAMLLAKQFYSRQPSKTLRYATLGLLFVNISVGGSLTHFAAPPILMVAQKWNISLRTAFLMLGEHAVIGVILSTLLYCIIFRREFKHLQLKTNISSSNEEILNIKNIPGIISVIHCLFLVWTVLNIHSPALMIFGFLFFLAFVESTKSYQDRINLKPSVLVGFFLAGLVIHGGLQEWWISPILGTLKQSALFLGSTILTAFNDNAAITYLASLVSEFSTNQELQKSVLSGAITGGGLTVIANSPNPAGQNILSKYFQDGISPGGLFYAAIIPTFIVAICFNAW